MRGPVCQQTSGAASSSRTAPEGSGVPPGLPRRDLAWLSAVLRPRPRGARFDWRTACRGEACLWSNSRESDRALPLRSIPAAELPGERAAGHSGRASGGFCHPERSEGAGLRPFVSLRVTPTRLWVDPSVPGGGGAGVRDRGVWPTTLRAAFQTASCSGSAWNRYRLKASSTWTSSDRLAATSPSSTLRHLYGFYFGITSRGTWAADTALNKADPARVVTQMPLCRTDG